MAGKLRDFLLRNRTAGQRRPTPVVDAIVARVKESAPLVGAIADGLRNAVADQRTTLTEVEQATIEHVAATVAPIIVNANDEEPPKKSRVVSGSTVAVASGVLMFLAEAVTLIPALMEGLGTGNKLLTIIGFVAGGGAFGGGLFALYGRLRKGLPPMDLSWNPFSWLAGRKKAE